MLSHGEYIASVHGTRSRNFHEGVRELHVYSLLDAVLPAISHGCGFQASRIQFEVVLPMGSAGLNPACVGGLPQVVLVAIVSPERNRLIWVVVVTI